MQTRGFISVTALGIFALLVVFVLLIQGIVTSAQRNILNNRNQATAQDLSDSIFQHLEREIASREAGYNSPTVQCQFNIPDKEDGCSHNVAPAVVNSLANISGDNQVEIEWEIKGRLTEEETLATNYRLFRNLYSVPAPGQGDAGINCKNYAPSYSADAQAQVFIAENLTLMDDNVDQLDYSCNWNRLILGSSATDRVTIPLYHDDGQGGITEPYFGEEGIGKEFYLRLRTPCNCPEGANGCSSIDRTTCSVDTRFELPSDSDDHPDASRIIAQWEISSPDCGNGEQCLIVGVEGEEEISLLNNSIIESARFNLNARPFSVLTANSLSKNNNNQTEYLLSEEQAPRESILSIVKNPKLSLLISDRLLTVDNTRIPYIEYQILTENPVTLDFTELKTVIKVNNSIQRKNRKIAYPKEFIDFAIQN